MTEVRNIFPKHGSTPLLIQTKLNLPRLGQKLIPRKRLIDKLDQGACHKLTLVSAPAGFGKSTLVAQWASKSTMATAWLSLDTNDNDLVLFWSYFINALKNIHPQLGRQSLDFLYSSSQDLIEKILTILINETNRYKDDFSIILDDFHVINDPAIYSSLKYLLNHLPPQFHIYIISRTTPSLPLASLRAKGQLLELLINDIRFNLKENKIFFKNMLHNVSLTPNELIKINHRLEGWVAGMQMASIVLNSSFEKKRFIHNLLGEQRHFTDYFYEEIFNPQPNEIKHFLLKTSILQRMNASLCNELTGNNNSQEKLEWLENLNLFIISLDEKRCWYRYHHLFAKILKDLFKQQEPESFQQIHQKASKWFKDNGFNSEAIFHALEGQNYEIAAIWIEEEASRTYKGGELTTLVHWIKSLPTEMLYHKPKIWLYYIWSLIHFRQFNDADISCMEMLDFFTDDNKLSLMKDRSLLDFIKSELSMTQGYLAVIQKKPKAMETFMKAMQKIQPNSLAEMITFNPGCASLLQTNSGTQGQLRATAYFYKSTEPIVKNIGDFPSFAVGYTILSEIHYEMNDWEEAEKYVRTALRLGKSKIDLGALVPAYIVASKIKTGQGEPYAALELLNSLEKEINARNCLHWFPIIRACETRIAIKMNNHEAVSLWMESCGLSIDDEINILQHYPFTTLIRAFLHLEQPDKALLLSDRMVILLDEEGGIGQRIEMLILQALSCHALNIMDRALNSLEQAIQMGAEEGYYRIFLDESKELFKLLKVFRAQQMLLL